MMLSKSASILYQSTTEKEQFHIPGPLEPGQGLGNGPREEIGHVFDTE